MERLTQLLNPLAERNGHHKGDGEALLDTLARIAGINLDSLATQMAAIPDLGALVTARYLDTLAKQVASGLPSDVYRRQLRIISDALSAVAMPGLSATSAALISSGLTDASARLADQLNAVDWAALAWAQSTKRKEVAQ